MATSTSSSVLAKGVKEEYQALDPSGGEVGEAEVDNATAGGCYARWGRESEGPRPTVIPPAPP